MSIKKVIKHLLPVSLTRHWSLSEDIKEQMLTASEAHDIHDALHWDISVQLLNEVKS